MLEKGESGQTYNICSGQAHSGHDILNGLAQAAGVMPETKEDPSKIRPSDYPVIYGNHDKLSRATGWQPEISLETTLADVIADWENR
jgi:GDP-4-dehydro-6-deoxy-D-mannose reductase